MIRWIISRFYKSQLNELKALEITLKALEIAFMFCDRFDLSFADGFCLNVWYESNTWKLSVFLLLSNINGILSKLLAAITFTDTSKVKKNIKNTILWYGWQDALMPGKIYCLLSNTFSVICECSPYLRVIQHQIYW